MRASGGERERLAKAQPLSEEESLWVLDTIVILADQFHCKLHFVTDEIRAARRGEELAGRRLGAARLAAEEPCEPPKLPVARRSREARP